MARTKITTNYKRFLMSGKEPKKSVLSQEFIESWELQQKGKKEKKKKIEFWIEEMHLVEGKDIFYIRWNNKKKTKHECGMDFFTTKERFLILRNYLTLNLKEYDGKPVTREIRILIVQKWIDIHQPNYFPMEAEVIYRNPGKSRKSSLRKSEANGSSIVIDLETDYKEDKNDDNYNNNENVMKSRERRNNRRREVKQLVMESNADSNSNNIMKITNKRVTIGKDNWISLSNSKIHRSKKEIAKIREKKHYEIKNEEDSCFIIALRSISNSFPLDLYSHAFKACEDINGQIKLANIVMKKEEEKVLSNKGVFNGTLKFLKENMKGKLIMIFLVGDSLHAEALNEGSYPSSIEKF